MKKEEHEIKKWNQMNMRTGFFICKEQFAMIKYKCSAGSDIWVISKNRNARRIVV